MQVLVPGVAQLVFGGRFGTQPWVVVHHWRLGTSTADWSAANMQSLCNAARTSYGAHLAKHGGNLTNLDTVTGVDIGASIPASAQATGSIPGTGAGGNLANSSMSAVMRNHINARYKGGHPRSYWPLGTTTDTANEYSWTNTFLTVFASDMVLFVSDIVAALPGSGSTAANHCVPLYTYEYVDDASHHKYRKIRSGLKAVYTVANYSTMQKFGTQRRRLAT